MPPDEILDLEIKAEAGDPVYDPDKPEDPEPDDEDEESKEGYTKPPQEAYPEVETELEEVELLPYCDEGGPPCRRVDMDATLGPGLIIGTGAGIFKLGWGLARAVEREAAKRALRFSPKILRQMLRRGWTRREIDEAIAHGKQIPAINKATGNPATRYVHPETGKSVVVDDVTDDVVQVGGAGFKHGPESGDLP